METTQKRASGIRSYFDGIRPSPIFFAVVAITALGGFLTAFPDTNSFTVDRNIALFTFVTAGWILSLIFHEFAHAFVAWKGGDISVAAKGYLTLNPLKYTNPVVSLIFPAAILLIGGIGLPGGAVWIEVGRLSERRRSAVSAAGPATNLIFALLCLLPLSFGLLPNSPSVATSEASFVLAQGLAFLGGIQLIAVFINMLPIPGLDGFGIIEPSLSPKIRAAIAPIRTWGFFILFGLVFYTDVGQYLWTPIEAAFNVLGIDFDLLRAGILRYRFWEL